MIYPMRCADVCIAPILHSEMFHSAIHVKPKVIVGAGTPCIDEYALATQLWIRGARISRKVPIGEMDHGTHRQANPPPPLFLLAQAVAQTKHPER